MLNRLFPPVLIVSLLVILVAAWLRAPFIRSGMPYFYDEDEAHHFNRVVNMVKRGEFDPKYFHKPSLHFYLRMPVVGLSFLAAVKSGEIRSIKEIITTDPFGVGDYAFSASHPKIAKWNRAWSVAWSLLGIAFCSALTWRITKDLSATFISTLLCALAPPLIISSAQIGVDVFVVSLATLTTLSSFVIIKSEQRSPSSITRALPFILAATLAGLTISTKYNAAPILLTPLVGLLVYHLKNQSEGFSLAKISLKGLGIVFLTFLAFVAASPFILANIPLFLDHVGYEVWHYAIAGHGEFTGEPGVAQALYFTKWFINSALGLPAILLAIAGLLLIVRRSPATAAILLAFPASYFIYMCQQRTNFPRNMHVLIPYVTILCGISFSELRQRFSKSWLGRAMLCAIFTLVIIQPAHQAVQARSTAAQKTDSRIELDSWLRSNIIEGRIAIDGRLQLHTLTVKQLGIERINFSDAALSKDILVGYDRLITSTGSYSSHLVQELIESQQFSLEKHIPGSQNIERVVESPEVFILIRVK